MWTRSSNPSGNEAEHRNILCRALTVNLLLVLRLIRTVMFVVNEVEPAHWSVIIPRVSVERGQTWERPLQAVKNKRTFQRIG